MKIFAWLSNNLLLTLSLFLLAFIPLFPKLPLFDALPGYIVKIRIEDVLIFITGLVWLRDIKTKRIIWNSSYFRFSFFYALAGILSVILGIFLLKTIPSETLHIGKSGLHLMRYLEYFSLFFFFFSAIRSLKEVRISLVIICVTLLGVCLYGFGQKYLRFPVYSTMNREYSKGEKLYLQEGARPQSTFAGHYDLAAYLVIVLPIIFSLAIARIKGIRTEKSFLLLPLFGLFILGVAMLWLSGSKTSIAAFAFSALVVVMVHWWRINNLRWKMVLAFAFVSLGLAAFFIGWRIAPVSIKEKVAKVLPFQKSTSEALPIDLVGTGYEEKIISVVQPDGSVKQTKQMVRSMWSENALKYGLSMGIRLDTLWPQALLGFARSPLTGSGYGTLAMLDSGLFQEADSTDNNYLRVLGETGIFGLITFFGLVLVILFDSIRLSRKTTETAPILIGLFGGTLGLLITSIYLDIFAASKVAFVFWAISGLVLKAGRIESGELSSKELLSVYQRARQFLLSRWPLLISILIALFLLHQNPFMIKTPIKDYDTFVSGVEEITSARCFIANGKFELCRTSGLVLASHFTIYSLLLVPFFRLFTITGAFYYLNLALILSGLFVAYFLGKKYQSKNIFLGLLSGILVTYIFSLSSTPLDQFRFWLLVLLVPSSSVLVMRFVAMRGFAPLRRVVLLSLIFASLLVFTNLMVTKDLALRYRPMAKNEAATAAQEANGILDSKPDKKAYLLSVLNPYYADQYSIGKYDLLPLSESQPYFEVRDKVWGVPTGVGLEQHLDSVLKTKSELFISDYGTFSNTDYRKSFEAIKFKYDLRYIHLGCEERCNLYSISESKPKLSPKLISPFNGATLDASQLPNTYKFSVVSNRFEESLSEEDAYGTVSLANKSKNLASDSQFIVFTGDVEEKPESVYTELFSNIFALKQKAPVLYSRGNLDIFPVKATKGGYQEFFTDSEYFVLLDVEESSKLTTGQQLSFYNTVLKLEKLSRVKTLIIISHDLDWKSPSGAKTISLLKQKLVQFPNLHVFVVTAARGDSQVWFEKTEKDGITYVSSLTAGNKKDVYVEFEVTGDDQILINAKKF